MAPARRRHRSLTNRVLWALARPLTGMRIRAHATCRHVAFCCVRVTLFTYRQTSETSVLTVTGKSLFLALAYGFLGSITRAQGAIQSGPLTAWRGAGEIVPRETRTVP